MGRSQILDDMEAIHDEEEQEVCSWRDWVVVISWSILGYLCIILAVIAYYNPSVLPFDPASLIFNKDVSPFFAFSRGSGEFPKPHGFKIVALVPFRDYERTAILDCYLQKNLIHKHGFLDQVVFVPETQDTVSLQWLKSLVEETPEYAISLSGPDMDWKFTQDDVLYVRIDGDVVFLEDHTIPTIVKTKLDNPSTRMVSANIVNEGALSFLHSHPGIALPYLPELRRVEPPSKPITQVESDWRASSLPQWEGPASFRVQKGFRPPFQGHRWLLPAGTGSDRDPIASSVYTETGPTLHDWTVSAQQHYSFLDHLESDTLSRYKFPLWVNPNEWVSSSFGCFWGKDAEALRDIFANKSDEDLSKTWTASDGSRPNITIDGKGLVTHYSAKLGADGLDATDLLERYRAYAQEKVCRQII